MQRKYFILALLAMLCLPSTAQTLYVCQGPVSHAFSIAHNPEISITPDSLHLGACWGYRLSQVDSLVFARPEGSVSACGWWSDGSTAAYHAPCYDENVPAHYWVHFALTATADTCCTARCELHFNHRWQAQTFLAQHNTDATSTNDPYIYVKSTQTGPRKREVWVMQNPVLPVMLSIDADAPVLWADCSPLLAGRSMDEVRLIVEAWVHQVAVQTENPNYVHQP